MVVVAGYRGGPGGGDRGGWGGGAQYTGGWGSGGADAHGPYQQQQHYQQQQQPQRPQQAQQPQQPGGWALRKAESSILPDSHSKLLLTLTKLLAWTTPGA